MNILNIKLNVFTSAFFISLIGICSCHEHKEGDSHNHGTEENTEAHSDEHDHGSHAEDATIASLTSEQMKSVNIQLGNIEQKQLTATIKVAGNLNVPNNNKANVTSFYDGVIKSLNVQLGASVKKGQIIATISNPDFINIQEEYLTIDSKIEFAEVEYKRQQELNDGNAGAKKNLQLASSELRNLKTRRASLVQQLNLMGIDQSKLSNENLKSVLYVYSPMNGVISNLYAKIGSYTNVSSPLAEIVDNSQIHLDLNLFEKDLPKIKVGQIIHFTLTNNPAKEYDAKIFNIGSSFENETKTIPVHCLVQGNKSGLIDGMNITGLVSLDNVTSPAVPSEAITSDGGKDYIFIVTDKKAEAHEEGEHAGHNESEGHSHDNGHSHKEEGTKKDEATINFEKVEIVKGVTYLGYTAITFLNELPKNTKIVTKGSFFVNAKMTNQGEGHSH